jgi:hypothetical protein
VYGPSVTSTLTQSSVVADGGREAETPNGCLVLHNAGTIAEKHNREPKNLKKSFTRSS